jgi:hypothetical protein
LVETVPAISTAVQNAMMHDVNLLGINESDAAYQKTVRSEGEVVSAPEGADIEYSGRIKSLDPANRTGVVIVAARSDGRKIFGLATVNVRFR